MTILGVSGKARAGKDEVAKAVGWFPILRFSTPVKEAIQAAYGFSDEQVWGNKKDEVDEFWGITPREAMFDFAENYMRGRNPDHWVMRMEKELEMIRDERGIIPDVRYENEIEMLRENHDAKIVRVIRPDRPETDADENRSETALDDYSDFDAIILNDSTLTDLHRKAKNIVNRLFTNNLKQNKDSTV